ncbi:MAG: type II toxin-antitoxin system VapC family toxin [Phycisphaerales bacterium]
MPKGPIRVYADTSVYGGVFDAEFEKASKPFFDQVRAGRFTLVVSALIEDELADAPPRVQDLFASMLPIIERALITADAIELQQAYLDAGIVSDRSAEDALHVAVATLSACDQLVSWNYKHIVHVEKGPRYNAVNVLRGLRNLAIHSPAEVIGYAEGL